MLNITHLIAFSLGALFGSWNVWSLTKRYRKSLGLNPNPLHVELPEEEKQI